MGSRSHLPSELFVCLYSVVLIPYHKDDKVYEYMTKFRRHPSEPYTLISPMSSLVDLEKFLETNLFALGKYNGTLRVCSELIMIQ